VARVEPIAVDALGPATPQPRAVPEPAVVELHRRLTLRRVSLWSVAKIALAFWTCVGVFAMTAAFLSWQTLRATGVVGNIEAFVGDLTTDNQFHFVPAQLMLAAVLATSAFVLAMTTLSVVGASFFNLMSRVMGGVDVELCETLPATEDTRTP
jgi:hypothetical protein